MRESVPLAYLGQDGDETSPRVLVQVTFYTPDGEDIDSFAWHATQPNGTVGSGKCIDRDVVGFAEFPRNQSVGRFTDREEFVETVESKSVYYHWKPRGDLPGTGAPFGEVTDDA